MYTPDLTISLHHLINSVDDYIIITPSLIHLPQGKMKKKRTKGESSEEEDEWEENSEGEDTAGAMAVPVSTNTVQ